MLLRIAIFSLCMAVILQLSWCQKKEKFGTKIKLENEDDLNLFLGNLDTTKMNLTQKAKIGAINKMIKAAKLDLNPKKMNQKDFKQNRTNIELIKNGNRTIVRDKDTNQTIDEVSSEDIANHQQWYWWG